MTATTVPAELPISEARAILTDIATAAKEHYAQTILTKHGKAVAKVVHPDAGVTPDPGLWQAAQEAYDATMSGDRAHHRTTADALAALGALLGSYYGYEERA
jgi:hypothetical protein